MKNNGANRKLVARIAMESLSFEEMEETIIYEFSERYQRQPDVFDSVVQTLVEINMLDPDYSFPCGGCDPDLLHPDIDYCDDCEKPT